MPEILNRIFVCYASIHVPSFITARCMIMKISAKIRLAIKHDTRCNCKRYCRQLLHKSVHRVFTVAFLIVPLI